MVTRNCAGCGTRIPEEGPVVCRDCFEKYTPRLEIVPVEVEETRLEKLTRLVTVFGELPEETVPVKKGWVN